MLLAFSANQRRAFEFKRKYRKILQCNRNPHRFIQSGRAMHWIFYTGFHFLASEKR